MSTTPCPSRITDQSQPFDVALEFRGALPTARRAIADLARFDLDWIEEPLRTEELVWSRGAPQGDRRARRARGERPHRAPRELLDAGACDVVQPNVVRVGGITPFLRIARLVRERGATLAPHLLLDLSGQLALHLDDEVEVEDAEDASFAALSALEGAPPVEVVDGWLTVGDHEGLGLTFR